MFSGDEELIITYLFAGMSCTAGCSHTVFLADDGFVYAFGDNQYGQLGFEASNPSIPTPIPSLPKIKFVSCGEYFTACVDEEGFIWTFGTNGCGQLGTGAKPGMKQHRPKKIVNIPHVQSISCGAAHILILTIDDNLWSCGWNVFGQLALGNKKDEYVPVKTSHSNISLISGGYCHSLFQNFDGKIYGCGTRGELGFNDKGPQINVCELDLPANIVQICSGDKHSLLLDSDGNVFYIGKYFFGVNQKLTCQIQGIPPIRSISCSVTCFLIDFNDFVWNFGDFNQFGDEESEVESNRLPKKLSSLKDICGISIGCCTTHFFFKDVQNKILSLSKNYNGQVEVKELNSEQSMNSHIDLWGNSNRSRIKSARK